MDPISTVATVVLATFDDEHALHGCRSVDEAAARLAGLDVPEIVVKCGADGALVLTGGDAVPVPARPVERVVDTTAAGDSFAGGYLAARLAGRPPAEAAQVAAQVAATVITHPGAIIPSSVPSTATGHPAGRTANGIAPPSRWTRNRR
jgi:2-dehydro-3-deoxygluconokinase